MWWWIGGKGREPADQSKSQVLGGHAMALYPLSKGCRDNTSLIGSTLKVVVVWILSHSPVDERPR